MDTDLIGKREGERVRDNKQMKEAICSYADSLGSFAWVKSHMPCMLPRWSVVVALTLQHALHEKTQLVYSASASILTWIWRAVVPVDLTVDPCVAIQA